MNNGHVERVRKFGGEDYFTRDSDKKDEHGFRITLYCIRHTQDWVEFKDLPENQRKAMNDAWLEEQAESQRRKDEDTKFHALYQIDKRKPTRLKPDEYYIEWIDKNGVNRAYVDMAFSVVNIYDRCISSGYTSYGIQEIDTWFCKRIQEIERGESEFTVKQMTQMILRHDNLHELIKWNLMVNLKRIKKQLNAGA